MKSRQPNQKPARAARRIVTGLRHHADTLTDLVLANGLAVSTTEDHPFWNATDQQCQPAEQLESGEQLLTANGTTATVERLDWATARDDTAYNLTVAGTHTYYVLAGSTPVLVHNSNCFNISSEADSIAAHANQRVMDPGGFEHLTSEEFILTPWTLTSIAFSMVSFRTFRSGT